jgi:redox-sensing transcriptional repressor
MSPGLRRSGARRETRDTVSGQTTARLSIYLRCLTQLEAAQIRTVSSSDLAARFDLNSAQIRKDLACLGEFGIRGVGYDVSKLKLHLAGALGIDRERRIIIVGAGNLGMALANYRGFHTDGFRIVALFDRDESLAGQKSRSGISVMSESMLPTVVREHDVEIGIIAVPAKNAQAVYETMVDAGIRAVLNFAPVRIRALDGVKIRTVDLRINLESLSFFLRTTELASTDTT